MKKYYYAIIISYLTSTNAVAQESLELFNIDCSTNEISSSYTGGSGYTRSTGTIIIDKLGNVLKKSNDFSFDENDKLTVIMVGERDFLKETKLERTSALRDSSIIRVLGENTQLNINTNNANLVAQGAGTTCIRKYDFDEFSPGEGIIKISTLDAEKKKVELGVFNLKVNPLYDGMFTFGFVKTDLVDKNFTVISNGTDNIISQTNTGEKDYQYSLMYTPFVWGKRDMEKSIKWYERINPSFGISLENISDNVFVGLSIDLPSGVVFTYGKHFGKVNSIDSNSGLSVGDTFTGTVPVSESWKDENFIAVSFDIRAIQKLFGFRENK